MARFVVTKKKKIWVESDGDHLDIGARSTCALTLDDPIAAERHAEIQHAEGEFFIRDLGSTTGTYLNGLQVAEPLPVVDGDVIIIGASRFTAHTERGDDGEVTLELALAERLFFQKAGKGRGDQAWVMGDREVWLEAEVSFSRFPLLWALVWTTALVAGVGCALLVIPGFRHRLVEPGRLHEPHALLFEAGDEGAALRELHADALANGCETCHTPGQGVPMGKCLACHEDISARHPFREEPLPGRGWVADACTECHAEHHGTGRGEGDFVPAPETLPQRCDGCHGHAGFTLENARKLVAARPLLASLGTRSVKVLYNTFSHAQHMGAEGIGECTVCHARVEGGELPALDTTGDDRARKDFAVVDFERCMGCHGGEREIEAPSMSVTWHGATHDESRCLGCHETLYSKELRSVPRDQIAFVSAAGGIQQPPGNGPKLIYTYRLRHHGAELTAAHAAAPGSCASCHRREDWRGSGEPRRGPFWHRVHMQSLDGDAVKLSSECASCHRPQADARGLARSHYTGAPEDRCRSCHQGDDTNIPRVANVKVIGGAGVRIDFPHDVHLDPSDPSLEKGCMSCHEFRSVGNAEYESIPVTRPEARDCSGCHGRSHDSIAGGDCDQCHGKGDPVYTTAPNDDGWPVTRTWPALNAFDHFSVGHVQVLEEGCENCHGNADRAKTIAEIPIPSEDSELCRGCHVEKKKRFHWR